MNNIQSEQQLEDKLIKQLENLEYDFVVIKDEEAMLKNLKKQLEVHNFKDLDGSELSSREFEKILHHLNKWTVFERAKILRDKMMLERDNWDIVYLEFIDMEHWCQNEFQVTNQVTIEWSYKNRYDVTLLVNWLPLVQIELKRRWLELKEAFNQTNRYQKHSYWAWNWLFQYVQLFVISNGVNTKYYANNKKQSFKQTFFWADEKNENITNLEEFTNIFLEPCHLSKMITKYIVLNETDKILMVLRPYQYFAVEAIIDRVQNSDKNGYIWHTTGSWKTLTSFKTSQILRKLPEITKVVFVVDRRDLDYQTTKEFNSFSSGSIDWTDNTKALVKQFEDDTPLIVTTIQKLNTAIQKEKYLKKMEGLKDKKIVFIFDECHRSQFGDTHKRIKKFFTHHQMFGFTGTPILEANNNQNKTTADLFDKCLHQYVITDAIKDENVLRFWIEYINTFKTKKGFELSSDTKVEDINTSEIFEDKKRIDKIVEYIIANHSAKTHSKYFTAMMCVSSVDVLIKYYEAFKKQNHNLNIATIFSYGVNEDDKDADGIIDDIQIEVKPWEENKHSRDKLEEFIWDYNEMFDTKYSTKNQGDFYNYYNDIAKRVKSRQIDILLVVNMFLTWFDSKTLNTLYVDKNLKYHWLIQAFSRTNRILNEQKSQWNIVCFRNLKKSTDEAIALFSNKNASEIVLMEPLEDYITKFNEALKVMQELTPTVDSVNDLYSEQEQFEFVKLFRELLRIKNILVTFSDFSFENIKIDEQTFENYKSKYLDIYDKVKGGKSREKVSILDDVDFELELIRRDEINIDYILNLLANLAEIPENKKSEQKKLILDIVSWDPKLRSKKELIEKFIDENLWELNNWENIGENFEKFFTEQRNKALLNFCKDEWIDIEKFEKVLSSYLYTWKMPLRWDIVNTLHTKPKILERTSITQRISDKMLSFIEKFEEL